MVSEQIHNVKATKELKARFKHEHLGSQSELINSLGENVNKSSQVYLHK